MKNILCILCICMISTLSLAQEKGREKVQTLKVAYLTEKLSLTPKEAQDFWPIYNEHQKNLKSFRRKRKEIITALRNNSNPSSSEASKHLDSYLSAEKIKFDSQTKMISSVRQVLPAEKVLKLIKAESDFNKKILEKIKERRRER